MRNIFNEIKGKFIMTPDQFIYWLCGYFTGGRDNDADAVVEDIKQALKKVKMHTENYLYFGGANE
jgi:hypothetical protein